MKILKTFALVILSFILILYSLVFMLGLGLEITALNIDHYKNMSREFDIFSQLNENLDAALLGPNETDENLTQQEQEMMLLFQEVFDGQWLEQQFLIAAQDILAYTKGQKSSLTAVIDLTDRKKLLKETITQKLIQEENVTEDQAAKAAQELNNQMNLPDEIHLQEVINKDVKNVLSRVTMIRRYFPVVSAVILVLIFVVVFLLTGLAGGLKWYGSGMIISALMLLILQLLLISNLNMTFLRSLTDIPTDLEPVLELIRYTFRKMAVVPIVYAFISLLFISSGVILGRRNKANSLK